MSTQWTADTEQIHETSVYLPRSHIGPPTYFMPPPRHAYANTMPPTHSLHDDCVHQLLSEGYLKVPEEVPDLVS